MLPSPSAPGRRQPSGYAYVADGTARRMCWMRCSAGIVRSCFLAETSFVLGATRILSNGNRIRFGYDWQSLIAVAARPTAMWKPTIPLRHIFL